MFLIMYFSNRLKYTISMNYNIITFLKIPDVLRLRRDPHKHSGRKYRNFSLVSRNRLIESPTIEHSYQLIIIIRSSRPFTQIHAFSIHVFHFIFLYFLFFRFASPLSLHDVYEKKCDVISLIGKRKKRNEKQNYYNPFCYR